MSNDITAPTVVYRHFSPDGTLLYVGCTVDVAQRALFHQTHSAWYVPGVRAETVVCGSPSVAREVEREAILAEFPRWNINGRAKNHPDGPAASHWHVGQMFPGTYREYLARKPWQRQAVREEPAVHYREFLAAEDERCRLSRIAWGVA